MSLSPDLRTNCIFQGHVPGKVQPAFCVGGMCTAPNELQASNCCSTSSIGLIQLGEISIVQAALDEGIHDVSKRIAVRDAIVVQRGSDELLSDAGDSLFGWQV